MAMFTPAPAGNPFVRSGNLNFQDPQGSYRSAYEAAAQTNQNLYQQTMGGYANLLASTQAGWAQLQRGVMRQLRGSNRANIQDIHDKYAGLWGTMSQQLIDRGLGNTTVQQSFGRGLAQDEAKEVTRSRGSFAQLMANALMQVGGNRLSALGQVGQNQLGYMASISAPYPDPGFYASLAARQGAGGGGGGGPGPSPIAGRPGGYVPDIFGGGNPGFEFLGGGGGAVDPSFYGNAGPGGGQPAYGGQMAEPGFWERMGNQAQQQWNYNYADVYPTDSGGMGA